MLMGPHRGVPENDPSWIGGRNGNHGYFGEDDWRPNEPGDWMWERLVYKHICFKLRAWRSLRGRRGRITARLTLHHFHMDFYREVGRQRGFTSVKQVLAWADDLYEKYTVGLHYASLLRPYGAFNPVETDHVYKKVGDEWVPFCTVFRKQASVFSLAAGECNPIGWTGEPGWPGGHYIAVQPNGTFFGLERHGGTTAGGGGRYPADALHLRRWTRYSPSPTENSDDVPVRETSVP